MTWIELKNETKKFFGMAMPTLDRDVVAQRWGEQFRRGDALEVQADSSARWEGSKGLKRNSGEERSKAELYGENRERS